MGITQAVFAVPGETDVMPAIIIAVVVQFWKPRLQG
jgi:hypothetical protein